MIAKKPKMAIYILVVVLLITVVAVGCTFTGAKVGNTLDGELTQGEENDENSGDESENDETNNNSNSDTTYEPEEESGETEEISFVPAEYSFSREEMDRIGTENRNEILSNPNTLVDIVEIVDEYGIEAFLDFDGDGVAETMQISPYSFVEKELSLYKDKHLCEANLWINDTSMAFSSTLQYQIWGYSPDGESIFLVLYNPGISDDDVTMICSYQKTGETGEIVKLLSVSEKVSECQWSDGNIYATISVQVLENAYIDVVYEYLGNNTFAKREEIHEYESEHDIQLLVSLQLKTELDGEAFVTVEPQAMRIKAYNTDFTWVLLEAADGTRGWLEVDHNTVVQNGKYVWDIFEGLWLAG